MKASEVKILLVDNHQMARQGLQQLIAARLGLTVVGEAACAQSAMEQIRTSGPHLVLMEIGPTQNESGVESVRQILAEFPAVRIIALSNESELPYALQALHAGAAGYVVKKHGVEDLFRAIDAVMEYEFYLSPDVSSAAIKGLMKSYLGRNSARAGVTLSDREQWLLQMIAGGKRNKEMAGEMAVGIKSVETYRSRLMKKLGCASVAELVRFAIREGVVHL